ncbi:hypothetical protein F511_04856 [Dorcoceras hygrometricum]|uniref:Splicing factor 3B subunit 1-like n=1 Tax=Dorcoceras hygrometricum TaxID=472368 RepID=A0A2Z7DC36_9LAMI|nr:hypothetical protein F511_04856 [Dorcoceras hygrometricum]
MASLLINNDIQIYIDSVYGMADEGMVQMLKDLESSRLHGFLGCSFAIYEDTLVEFFQNASVRDNKVVSAVQGKAVEISEEVFAGTFELPTEGLTEMTDVPKDLVFDERSEFSMGVLAKTVIVKYGSFDVVIHERFLMMSAIHGGVMVNWGRLLFNIFRDMVTPASKQARGFTVHICILLKGAPDPEFGESKEFPPLKILTAKTVGTYVAKNKNIAVEEVVDEPVVKKAAPRRIPAPAVAMTPRAPRRREPKRKLVLQKGSDDEIVDNIIHQVITETAEIEIGEQDLEEPVVMETTETVAIETDKEKEKEKEIEPVADEGVRVDAQLANLWRVGS